MLLNPFTIYGLMWSGVIFLYSLNLGIIYPKLNSNLIVFLLMTSLISLFLGIVTRKSFDLNKNSKKTISKHVARTVLIIYIFFIIEILLEGGKIPLVEILKKNGYTRHDFHGIKSLHHLMMIFTVFYSQCVISNYIKTNKKINLLFYLLLNLIFLIFYLRGIIFISLFTALIIFIINRRISLKKILILSIVFIYLFGIIGNIREGDKWNGNRTFIKSGVIKENSIVNGPLIFGYVYFTCSLANLSLNVNNEEISYSFENFIKENILVDFLKSRIRATNTKEVELIIPTLNTITTYTKAYISFGFLGMYILFFVYMIILLFYTKYILMKTRYFNELLAILYAMIFFIFFTNTLTFSLISFQLIFPLLDCVYIKIKKSSLSTQDLNCKGCIKNQKRVTKSMK